MEAFRLNLSKCYQKVNNPENNGVKPYCIGRCCSMYPTCLRARVDNIVDLRKMINPLMTKEEERNLRVELIHQEERPLAGRE